MDQDPPNKKNSYKEVWQLTARILEAASPVKKIVFWTCLLTGLASLFQLIGLGLIVPVLNGIVDPNHYEALLNSPPYKNFFESLPFELSNKWIFGTIIGLVLLSAYLENLFLYLGQLYSAKLSTVVAHRLRVNAFERYLGFSKSFFDRANLGEIQVLLTSLITGVGQHLHFVSQLLVVSCFAMAFLVLMVAVSWKLTILAFVMLPITHFCSSFFTSRLRQSAEGEVNNMLSFSRRTMDILQNIPLTKLAGMEEAELSKIRNYSDEVRRHGENTRAKRFLIPRVVDCINTTGIILLACGAIFLIFKVEALSIGRLSVFFIALRRFTSYVQQIFVYWSNCIGSLPHVEEVLGVFSQDHSIKLVSGDIIFPGVEESIIFKDVSYTYPDGTQSLQGVSFEVKPGSMTAFVGPSGAGKTTLMNLIPRFIEPSHGSIKINGKKLQEYTVESLRQKIAIVSQSTLLFQDTLRNNLVYGLSDISEAQIVQSVEDAQLSEYVSGLEKGLDTRVGKDGVQLSGGERQRLSIARAILRNPDILLLDEATSALDAETESRVQAAVDYITENRTVLIVAHRLSTIQKASNIFVLEKGEIVENGSAKELSNSGGVFQRYCELQNLVC